MSWPDRMPPSNRTSQRPSIASTISGSTEIVEGAPSSWRPPWFDTTMASAPAATANCASSRSSMPFKINLPGQRLRTHATSRQLTDASNCVPDHSASVLISLEPPIRPTRLPKVRRLPKSTLPVHEGLVIRSKALRRVSRGGMVSPLRGSRCRCPSTCKSRVSTSAEHWAAIARSMSSWLKPRVAHQILLEPERLLGCGAHILDGTDGHGAQAKRYAESGRGAGAEDLAVRVEKTRHPRGCDGQGHGHRRARQRRGQRYLRHVDHDPLPEHEGIEIRGIASEGPLIVRAAVRIVEDGLRYAPPRELLEVADS